MCESCMNGYWSCVFDYWYIDSAVLSAIKISKITLAISILQSGMYIWLDLVDDQNDFFKHVFVVFKNTIKTHLPSSSFDASHQIMLDIEKNIVDVIVGDMMFDLADIIDNNFDNDAELFIFYHEWAQCCNLSTCSKGSICKRASFIIIWMHGATMV